MDSYISPEFIEEKLKLLRIEYQQKPDLRTIITCQAKMLKWIAANQQSAKKQKKDDTKLQKTAAEVFEGGVSGVSKNAPLEASQKSLLPKS